MRSRDMESFNWTLILLISVEMGAMVSGMSSRRVYSQINALSISRFERVAESEWWMLELEGKSTDMEARGGAISAS